jgi:hypothetical protein
VVEYQLVACRILRSRIDPGQVGVSVSCLPLYPQAHADRSADLLVNHSSRCNTANLKCTLKPDSARSRAAMRRIATHLVPCPSRNLVHTIILIPFR